MADRLGENHEKLKNSLSPIFNISSIINTYCENNIFIPNEYIVLDIIYMYIFLVDGGFFLSIIAAFLSAKFGKKICQGLSHVFKIDFLMPNTCRNSH